MIPRCQIPEPQADQQMRPNPETEVSFVPSSYMVTLCKKVAKLFDEAAQPEHNMHSSLTCLSFLENVSTCSQVQCKAQPDCADGKGLNSNNPHLTFEQLHGLIQHVCHVNAMSNTRQRKGAQLQITGGFSKTTFGIASTVLQPETSPAFCRVKTDRTIMPCKRF